MWVDSGMRFLWREDGGVDRGVGCLLAVVVRALLARASLPKDANCLSETIN